METIGSAERSTDKEQMRDTFHTISDGQYAELLYKLFGKKRVEKELEEFLEFDFFPRSGGGIGVTRIMQAIPDDFFVGIGRVCEVTRFDSFPQTCKIIFMN